MNETSRCVLPADRRGVLWIADRGYTDHTLFAESANAHGYFLVRLKTSSLPTITTIRSGVAKANLHEPLTPELPVRGVALCQGSYRLLVES